MEAIEQNGNTGEHYPIMYPELSARLKNIKLDPSSAHAHYDIRRKKQAHYDIKEWKASSPYYQIVKRSDSSIDDRYAIWVGSDIIYFYTLLQDTQN